MEWSLLRETAMSQSMALAGAKQSQFSCASIGQIQKAIPQQAAHLAGHRDFSGTDLSCCSYLCPYSMLPLHSITQWFRLEGASGGHPVQLPCSGRVTWRRPMEPGPCPNGFWRSPTTCIPGAYVCQKTSLSSILKLLRLTCQGHFCSPFWERVPLLSVWTAQETKRWSPSGLYEIFPHP